VVRGGRGKLIFGNGEVAHYETELAELLDEPERPQELTVRRVVRDALPPFVALVATLAAIALIGNQTYVSISAEALSVARKVALVWFGLLVPGVLLIRYSELRRNQEQRLPAWTLAHRRWTGLYYCSRDDIVFSPVLNAFAAPQEVDKLLYGSAGQIRSLPQAAAATSGLREA
jgi:hypothetical protein